MSVAPILHTRASPNDLVRLGSVTSVTERIDLKKDCFMDAHKYNKRAKT